MLGGWSRFPFVAWGDTAEPMAEQNKETIQRIFESWGEGDFSAGLDDLDPNVLFVVRPPFSENAVLVGPAAISEFLLSFFAPIAPGSLTVTANRIRKAGDTVIADVTHRMQGRTSGIEGDLDYFMLFTFRGTKIVRIESIIDRAEALEAAGLSVEGGSG